jgi:EVE domain
MVSEPRYWLAIACREHVLRGIEGGFCQVCHGKGAPLRRMKEGDGLVYYSSKERMDDGMLCQRFTAIGQIAEGGIEQVQMSESFCPFRRAVSYYASTEASILPLIADLACMPDKKRWGYPLRYGLLEISKADFQYIAEAMCAQLPGEIVR